MLAPSWKLPILVAPSPKKVTAMLSSPRYWAAKAAPTAIGTPAPTMPLAPSMPRETSLMCMLPPRPRQAPVTRPYSSEYMCLKLTPLATACPCPRWVEVIWSSSRRAAITPAATAS